MYEDLSPFARELIADARRDLGTQGPTDHHVHIAGIGPRLPRTGPEAEERGIWLHPDYRSWRHPYRRLQALFLLHACGIVGERSADTQYLERLLTLVQTSGLSGSYMVYALDWRYERPPANREPNKDKTDLFVDNSYVIEAAASLNRRAAGSACFIPVASVHPYRRDAIDALESLAQHGVRHLKWLPPAQNIDPAEPSLRPFFQALYRLRFVLLSHTGDEHTLRVDDRDQDLADPLRLSLAIEEGVTVVMLHAGRDGVERAPGRDGKRRSYADRFFEMMKRYPPNLFGEISTVPYLGTHRLLERLLQDPEITPRLVNGSDYPAPAIPGTDPTGRLFRSGYLRDPADNGPASALQRRNALREIRRQNPLLFDFVLKRTLRVNGQRLPSAIFRSIDDKIRPNARQAT